MLSMKPDQHHLKNNIKQYWNTAACGTEFIQQQKYSKAYFEAIEDFRYTIEPEIFSFAQFSRFYGKKILEVGIGAGTDFLQWTRAGADCYGIDLTQEAVTHVNHRLKLYNLHASDVRIADAEQLPYADNSFDLVYSWGVIHHSPDTIKSLTEIIRVTKHNGKIKIMIYNRHSLFAFYQYARHALFKGRLWWSIKKVLYHFQESPGTKAFSFNEIKNILAHLPVKIIDLKAPVTKHDLLYYKSKPIQLIAYFFACILGWHRSGWFMMIDLEKV